MKRINAMNCKSPQNRKHTIRVPLKSTVYSVNDNYFQHLLKSYIASFNCIFSYWVFTCPRHVLSCLALVVFLLELRLALRSCERKRRFRLQHIHNFWLLKEALLFVFVIYIFRGLFFSLGKNDGACGHHTNNHLSMVSK